MDETDVNEIYKKAVDKMMESMANFQRMGSNWQFRSVKNLDINTTVYKPLRGNSYIPLPKELANKKAIINLKNNDNLCFKWAVTRALNPVERMQREQIKIYKNKLKNSTGKILISHLV